MRYILIAALYLVLVTLVPRQIVQVEKLPACKSGWKPDAALTQAERRYIPVQYLYRVFPGPHHMMIQVIGPDGRMLARVRKGEAASFDCFDDTAQCGPGDRCV